LLGTLGAEAFRQEADSLRAKLTDAAIDRALNAGPPETQATIEARLKPLLHSRREQLPEVAQRYYEFLAEEPWLVGTDQAERFVLSEAGPGQLRVRMLALRANQPDSLLAERVYKRTETAALHLYGLAGNDVFELVAPLRAGIAVHIHEGEGRNQLVNSANQAGTVSGITWHSSSSPASIPNSSGISTKPDQDSAHTTNSKAWLKRYRLDH
jgi:hypothetical protein